MNKENINNELKQYLKELLDRLDDEGKIKLLVSVSWLILIWSIIREFKKHLEEEFEKIESIEW